MEKFYFAMGVHTLSTIPTVFVFDPVFAQLSLVQLWCAINLKINVRPLLVINVFLLPSCVYCNVLLTVLGFKWFRLGVSRTKMVGVKWCTRLPEMLGHCIAIKL
jgi:hypothetical protein